MLQIKSFFLKENTSQEYEINYDDETNLYFHDDGFLDANPQTMINYTLMENKLIVLSWKKAGLHPDVGTEQPKDTYWRRMKEYFYVCNKSANERMMISIHHRWGTISTDC
jgi:hypothetical protein